MEFPRGNPGHDSVAAAIPNHKPGIHRLGSGPIALAATHAEARGAAHATLLARFVFLTAGLAGVRIAQWTAAKPRVATDSSVSRRPAKPGRSDPPSSS